MDTFAKEITFISPEYDQVAHDAGTPGVWNKLPVTKTATFLELDQTDRDQHKFHFKLMGFFAKPGKEGEEEDEDEKPSSLGFDTDATYDLATKFIKKFHVPNPEFTLADRESVLTDSGALVDFALWLVKDKFIPFFLKLRHKPTA